MLLKGHKGILLNSSETYVVKIRAPANTEILSINNQEVNLNSDNITIDL